MFSYFVLMYAPVSQARSDEICAIFRDHMPGLLCADVVGIVLSYQGVYDPESLWSSTYLSSPLPKSAIILPSSRLWVDSDTVERCPRKGARNCERDFSLLTRKHHCRGCGKVCGVSLKLYSCILFNIKQLSFLLYIIIYNNLLFS